jgi:hypothetical protein
LNKLIVQTFQSEKKLKLILKMTEKKIMKVKRTQTERKKTPIVQPLIMLLLVLAVSKQQLTLEYSFPVTTKVIRIHNNLHHGNMFYLHEGG